MWMRPFRPEDAPEVHDVHRQAFGFERASDHGLGNEYGADEEFQVLALNGPLPAVHATVRYGPEFAGTDG